MGPEAILVVVLLIMLVAALPSWQHSRTWGYLPSGSLGVVLGVLIILMFTRGL